jgi:hypothetical protein
MDLDSHTDIPTMAPTMEVDMVAIMIPGITVDMVDTMADIMVDMVDTMVDITLTMVVPTGAGTAMDIGTAITITTVTGN